MTSIDCPFCDGLLLTDEARTDIDCDACGVTLDYAPDPRPVALPVAA